jgi:hypothetical protein
MAEKREKESTAGALALGGMGGAMLGAIAALLLARPAKAAPPDEKLDYLLECLTALIPVLAEVAERQAALIALLEQWLAAQGIAPGIEVTVKTPWIAKEPEEIFKQEILAVGDYYSDKMVDWTKGKRILFKVESTLNQPVQIQLIGNTVDSLNLTTDINAPQPCPANSNISIGPAWDDWHPYIGVRITAAVAPTAGILTIWAVIQE